MKIENQVCSLELAKQLELLGVEKDSLFVWAEYEGGKSEILYATVESAINGALPRFYSAFTCAELLELCPKYTEIKKCWPSGTQPEHFYLISNVEVRWNGNPYMLTADTMADVAAKFIIYLLENNLISYDK